MRGRGHAVNDPARYGLTGGNEIIRFPVEDKAFILSRGDRATASFLFLDRRGRISM
jgi:hypothetical protein